MNKLVAIRTGDGLMLVNVAPGTLLWPAAMIVWGPGERTSAHAHHCVQLVMALEGKLRVRRDSGEDWTECGAVIIKADVLHEVDARGAPALIATVDVESAVGAAMAGHAQRDITVVSDAEVYRWREQLGEAAALSSTAVEAWIRANLLESGPTPAVHPGVRRVLRYLRENVGQVDKFTLSELAQVAQLSSSRMMHAFTESVGVPLRPYVLWLRLQVASGELMRGRSATESAHAAGFSDAAHMSRTFRRMLGTTPAELAARRHRTHAAFLKLD